MAYFEGKAAPRFSELAGRFRVPPAPEDSNGERLPVTCTLTAIYRNLSSYIRSVFQIHHGRDDVVDLSDTS